MHSDSVMFTTTNLVFGGLGAEFLLRTLVLEIMLLGLGAHVLLERATGCPVLDQVFGGEREGNVCRRLWTRKFSVQDTLGTESSCKSAAGRLNIALHLERA